MNVIKSCTNFKQLPKRNVGPNALQSAGKIDACFLFCFVLKFTLADDFVNVAEAMPFAGSGCACFATDLFQYFKNSGETSID